MINMENNRNLLVVGPISMGGLMPVNLSDEMKVYAVVSITGGGQKTEQMKAVDIDGGTNPTRNSPMIFLVDYGSVQSLLFKLRSNKDIDIGEVQVPVKELIMGWTGFGISPTYKVRTPSGNLEGHLHFLYEWGNKVTGAVLQPPTVCYHPVFRPPSPYGAAGAAPPPPPPPPPPGYGYPPQPGFGFGPQYGYPPQPGYDVYGYPPVQPRPAKNKKSQRTVERLGKLAAGVVITEILHYGPPDDSGFESFLGDLWEW